jgi:hypothetical protein
MIGSGAHHGFAGIHLSIGIIGQYGGIHITALRTIFIGSIFIGITTTTQYVLSVQAITTIHIMLQCVTA